MIKILLFISLVTPLLGSAQNEDLDAIFDDPKATFNLYLGTSALRCVLGTPNLSVNTQFFETVAVQAEYGVTPFSYRERLFGPLPQGYNINGSIVTFNAFYTPKMRFFEGDFFWQLGPEFQYTNYASRHKDILLFSAHNLEFFTNEENGFAYKRRLKHYGFNFGFFWDGRKRWCGSFSTSFGAATSEMAYFEEESTNVTWAGNPPEGFVPGRTEMTARFQLHLFYKLF